MAARQTKKSNKVPKKLKGGNIVKKHRFEPFSQRIARLKIDPVHRVKSTGLESSSDAFGSHFKACLDHWKDLNASASFTEFCKTASPLCESLPQLLYHADTLNELLLRFIGKRDPLSAEPLLNLLGEFAHDLGARFEQYFLDAVSLILSVAADHNAPEVIEWSFTSLAWMFKFLSKLLVPDLTPLLDVMLPYLGKIRQKDYVTRFAAESVVYLIRKAASQYDRNQKPLDGAVTFLLKALTDVPDRQEQDMMSTGLMTLFSGAMLGVNGGLHSCGLSLWSCLLKHTYKEADNIEAIFKVVKGALISLIHQSNSEGLLPLTELIYTSCSRTPRNDNISTFYSIELLIVLAATRKGTRIQAWKFHHEIILKILKGEEWLSQNAATRRRLAVLLAQSLVASPMDHLLPYLDAYRDAVVSEPLSNDFLLVSSVVADQHLERFQNLLQPCLRKFIISRWQENPAGLCCLVRLLYENHAFQDPRNPFPSSLPSAWEDWMLQTLDQEIHSEDDVSWQRNVLQSIHALPLSGDFRMRLLHLLLRRIRSTMASGSLGVSAITFALGLWLNIYAQEASQLQKLDVELLDPLIEAVTRFHDCTPLIEGFARYFAALRDRQGPQDRQRERLTDSLTSNLLTEGGRLKFASLKLLREVIEDDTPSLSDVFSLAIELLSIRYNLQNIRQMSMLVRRLPALHKAVHRSSPAFKLIPYLCLGMLTMNMPQLEDTICHNISEMCEDKATEEMIASVVLSWLAISPQHDDMDVETRVQATELKDNSLLTDFQCSNLDGLEKSALLQNSRFDSLKASLREEFRAKDSDLGSVTVPFRNIALHALEFVPKLAERRSKVVVPLFLSSVYGDGAARTDRTNSHFDNEDDTIAENDSISWTMPQRKAFLKVLGQFINPKALYRTSDVYEGLLHTLMVGDGDTQKLAIQAISTWKSPSIQPYQDLLASLADERRYRDQLAKLFQDNDENAMIQPNHRGEIVPLILRVLYGQTLNKGGGRGRRSDQEDKRKIVLRAIFQMEDHEVQQFISISLGPLADVKIVPEDSTKTNILEQKLLGYHQQHGMLNMLSTMLETMGGGVASHSEQILNATLYCLVQACRSLQSPQEDLKNHVPSSESLTRRGRRIGIHCLNLLFKTCHTMNWQPYVPLIFSEIINPRLPDLPVETAQGISGLLHLFSTWASIPAYFAYLSEYTESLLDTIADCIVVPSAQDDVKVFVLDRIYTPLGRGLLPSPGQQDGAQDFNLSKISEQVLVPHLEHVLTQLAQLIEAPGSRAVLDAAINTLSALTPFAKTSGPAERILNMVPKLLTESSHKVNVKTKDFLLKAMRDLLSTFSNEISSSLRNSIFESISALFGSLAGSSSRLLLVEILQLLAYEDIDLKVAQLCADLNAQSSIRLDSIDYDRRLFAFSNLNETTLMQSNSWVPILQNLIFFAKDNEDFAIRSNTIASLKHYIEYATSYSPHEANLLRTVLLPALRKGIKVKSEVACADHVGLMGLLVSKCSQWSELSDMVGLLANDDEEASFFNNIFHIQQHRRLRAMRRLVSEAEQGKLKSSNIANFFIPLLERFVFDQNGDESAHNLVGQSIETIGVLLKWVQWNQFKASFSKYKSFLVRKETMGKYIIKLASAGADAFHLAVITRFKFTASSFLDSTEDPGDPSTCLSRSLPPAEILAADVLKTFVPDLASFVHHKDETEMSLRIPICVAVAKLAIALNADQQAQILPPLFLDIAYILRSRSPQSRDAARKTLGDLINILGPSCLPNVLRELRTALARGYQLHVLSFTTHSILVSSEQHLRPGEINECLSMLVTIVMDDIFGTVGQEKDAVDYTSKMKEVKSSKSYDSMELLAKLITIDRLVELVEPLQSILMSSLTSKQSRQVDELFRRIGTGLIRNTAAGTQDMLIFTYQLIQSCYHQGALERLSSVHVSSVTDQRVLAPPAQTFPIAHSGNRAVPYKTIRFALDIIRSTLSKHDALCTAENIHGFIPIIGDALMQQHEEIKISAFRLLSTIIKLPLKELDDNAKLFTTEAVKVLKESVTTNSEAAQAALKLLTAYLRERRDVTLRESDLGYVLKRIMPDLEEPDRQGVTFNFVKAIMARKLTLPEVYELMDKVAVMVVTNHSRNTRDVARGAFVHFLLEYPQAKSRWAKQVKFLVKNLEYEHAEGRQSVMEAINTLLSKCGGAVAEDIIDTFFIPLVLLMSNDETVNCREMAAALLGLFFQKSNEEKTKELLSPVRSWLQQSESPTMVAAGMQVCRIYLDTSTGNQKAEVSFIRSCVFETLKTRSSIEDDESWEPLYNALQVLLQLCHASLESVMNQKYAAEWTRIGLLLNHAHPWIQATAADLIGLFFHDLAKANAKKGLGFLPLIGSGGLQLHEELVLSLTRSSLSTIRKNRLNKDLASQTVRNLVFLGRCFKENAMTTPATDEAELSSGDEALSNEDNKCGKGSLAIHYLLDQTAIVLRAETTSEKATALLPRTTALQLLAALCSHVDAGLLRPCVGNILLPLQHLTDPSIPAPSSLNKEFQASYKALIAGCHELLDALQKKLGTTEFVAQMGDVQKVIRERREDRRTKRRIEAVANPEKYGREKQKKADRKKIRKREKGMEFRGRRRGW
ncbi:MAG: hypothetical protein Q9227_002347 [Pyrenula ochraceoflavens]